MPNTLLSLTLLLAPQLWAVWTRRSAPQRLLLLLLSLSVFLGLSLAQIRRIRLSSASDTGLHDTYYVVSHSHYIASHIVILLALTALVGAAARWAGPLPRATAPLASLLALSITPAMIRTGWIVRPPHRYTDYPEYVATLARLDAIITLTFTLTFLLIALLASTPLLRRLNHWSKQR